MPRQKKDAKILNIKLDREIHEMLVCFPGSVPGTCSLLQGRLCDKRCLISSFSFHLLQGRKTTCLDPLLLLFLFRA